MRSYGACCFARTSNRMVSRLASIAVAALVVGGCSGQGESTDGPVKQVVYFDRETKKPVVAAVQPTPAVNPATGRRTLDRALYCERCKVWHAVPADSAANGNPLATKCPKHKCAMTAEGPLPK